MKLRHFIFWAAGAGTAPIAIIALVSLGTEVYSRAVGLVSLSFRFFAQGRSTDTLHLPSPAVACGMLLGWVALWWVLRRTCYKHNAG